MKTKQQNQQDKLHHTENSTSFNEFHSPKHVSGVMDVNDVFENLGFGRYQLWLFVVCGLAYMADACEVNLLTFMTHMTAKEWGLTKAQESSVASAVFVGEFFGGFIWGRISDSLGRRRAFLLSMSFSIGIGLLSALSTSFWMLFILRGLVGIGVAGLFVPFDILLEMVPCGWRGPVGLYIEAFWGFGSMFVAGSAWLTLDSWGWRWLTVLTALPLIISLCFYPWLPESPRWLLEKGRHDEAVEIVQRIAKRNKVAMSSQLEISYHKEQDGSLKDVFSPSFRYTTISLLFIWLLFGFSYYGVVIFDSEIFPSPEGSEFHYSAIFITSSFEVTSLIFPHMLLKYFHGSTSQAFLFTLAGFGTLLLSFNFSNEVKILLMGIARGSVFGAQAVLWVITPEYYPTYIRASAHGFCYAASRIGSITTPYWGKSGLSITTIVIVYCITNMIAALASLTLKKTNAIDHEGVGMMDRLSRASVSNILRYSHTK